MKLDTLTIKIRREGPYVTAQVFTNTGEPDVAVDTMLMAILQMAHGERLIVDDVIERTTARMKEIATTLVLPKEAIDC